VAENRALHPAEVLHQVMSPPPPYRRSPGDSWSLWRRSTCRSGRWRCRAPGRRIATPNFRSTADPRPASTSARSTARSTPRSGPAGPRRGSARSVHRGGVGWWHPPKASPRGDGARHRVPDLPGPSPPTPDGQPPPAHPAGRSRRGRRRRARPGAGLRRRLPALPVPALTTR
jgi:hypothetical protein